MTSTPVGECADGAEGAGPGTPRESQPPVEEASLQPSAHGKGLCEVLLLAPDGHRLLTTGADGRLACLEAEPGEKPEKLEKPMELSRSWAQKLSNGFRATTAAISSDGRMLAVAEETASGFQAWVHLLDVKGRVSQGQKPRNAGRFTLDIRHLSWHPSLPYLCIATDDGKVDVWYEGDPSTGPSRKQVFKGGGTSGGVRCACMDLKAERVAAAFASGDLAVFKLESSTELYRGKMWSKSVTGSEKLLMSWEPKGDQLALPGHPYVRLMSMDGSVARLEGGHRFATTMASWSPSGHVLVSASAEALAVWTQGSLCRILRFTAEPSSIVWGGCDFIAVGTQAGYFVNLKVLAEEAPNAAAPEAATEAASGVHLESQASEAAQTDSQAKEDSQESAAADSQVDAAAASSQLPGEVSETSAPPKTRAVQKSFQPGATVKGRRRFLAWNDSGALKLSLPTSRTVRGIKTSQSPATTGAAQVEVDYYLRRDPCAVRSLKVEESIELGAIGPNLCALASNACANSTIVVHVASPWKRTSFQHTLPGSERTEALALSSSFVAVFVSPQRFLRIFTTSFLPLGVLSIAGEVVSMVAREDLLLVVYQRKPRKEPHLRFMILNVTRKEKLGNGTLPLSPSSTLRWIGFSAEMQPLAMDSRGVLRMLLLSGSQPNAGFISGNWIPVAEIGSGLWPVRAAEGSLSCVKLGSGQEPKAGSAYRFEAVPYKLPLGEATPHSEAFLRQSLLAAHWAQATTHGWIQAPPAALRLKRAGPPSSSPWKLLQALQQLKEEELSLDVLTHFLSAENVKECKARDLGSAAASATEAGLQELAAQLISLSKLKVGDSEEADPRKMRKLA